MRSGKMATTGGSSAQKPCTLRVFVLVTFDIQHANGCSGRQKQKPKQFFAPSPLIRCSQHHLLHCLDTPASHCAKPMSSHRLTSSSSRISLKSQFLHSVRTPILITTLAYRILSLTICREAHRRQRCTQSRLDREKQFHEGF